MSARVRSEIEVGFAGHDNMHAVMLSRKREPVRRLQAGLRRDERPGSDAGVNPSRLDGGKQAEQEESMNESSSNDEAESGRFG